MDTLEVHIVELEPLRVAAAYGFGAEPESVAWEKLMAFVDAKGLTGGDNRYFGFNHPDPSPGSPNYGYEQWITVDEGVEAEGDITIKAFMGGLYAVARWEGTPNPSVWQQLVHWTENSAYRLARHQWLEELISSPDLLPDSAVFDLYLPVTR